MSEDFMELSKEDIGAIENALKFNGIYKLKDSKFEIDSFQSSNDINMIQQIADVKNDLSFKTKYEDGKYFISSTFDLFMDSILNEDPRDVFQYVSDYFLDVIEDADSDFNERKDELINFLILTEEYDEEELKRDLDPLKIRQDYQNDYEKVCSDDSLNSVQKSLALKELVHMSICYLVNDLDMFFTRPLNLSSEESREKDRQEAEALKNEMRLG